MIQELGMICQEHDEYKQKVLELELQVAEMRDLKTRLERLEGGILDSWVATVESLPTKRWQEKEL